MLPHISKIYIFPFSMKLMKIWTGGKSTAMIIKHPYKASTTQQVYFYCWSIDANKNSEFFSSIQHLFS